MEGVNQKPTSKRRGSILENNKDKWNRLENDFLRRLEDCSLYMFQKRYILEHQKLFDYTPKVWSMLFTFHRYCENELFDLKNSFWSLKSFANQEIEANTEVAKMIEEHDIIQNYKNSLTELQDHWAHSDLLDFLQSKNLKNYDLELLDFDTWKLEFQPFLLKKLLITDDAKKIIKRSEKCVYL